MVETSQMQQLTKFEVRFRNLSVKQQENINAFTRDFTSTKKSVLTVKQYRFYLTHFFSSTRNDIATITKKDVDEFLYNASVLGIGKNQADGQAKPVTGQTMRVICSCLNSFFDFHGRKELRISSRKYSTSKTRGLKILSIPEREKLFDVAEEFYGLKWRALFEFSFWEALRISDAINIKLSNINFENKKVTILQGKGNVTASIDLLPKAETVIKRYINSQKFDPKQEFLFMHIHKKGKFQGKLQKYYQMKIDRVFNDVCEKAGFGDGYSFHILRHSCASCFLKAGGESAISNAGRHLRHKEGSPVTLRYLHSMDGGLTKKQLKSIGGI